MFNTCWDYQGIEKALDRFLLRFQDEKLVSPGQDREWF